MKIWLTYLLLLSGITLTAQSILNNKINFDVYSVTVDSALIQLSEVTATNISYSKSLLPDKIISLNIEQKTLEYALKRLLLGTSVAFKVIDNQVVLYQKRKTIQKITLSGYVEDAHTGERLIATNIYEPYLELGTTSNDYGFFSITLPKGIVRIYVSYFGYQPIVKEIDLKKNTTLKIELESRLTFEEVVVIDSSDLTVEVLRKSDNIFNIPLQSVKTFPNLGGENDIIRTAALLPGIQAGTDGFGGIHVRGGSSDQNLILMDGVPVYNAGHFAGIFSVFNPSAVKSAQLITGGFPGQYSGRLSSVLDVHIKEGNTKSFKSEGTIGGITANISLEGPIIKEKSSYFIALRRSLFELYVRPISRSLKEQNGEKGISNYTFYDINAKINYKISNKDKIYLSLYKGNDAFDDNTITDIVDFEAEHDQVLKWGNYIAALRWNHLFGNKLFSNSTATFSHFGFNSEEFYHENKIIDFEEQQVNQFNRYSSFIEDLAFRTHFDYFPVATHNVKFGFGATIHNFLPGAFSLANRNTLTPESIDTNTAQIDSLITINNKIVSTEFILYAEDQIGIFNKVNINIGAHFSSLFVEDTMYLSLQPRFVLNWHCLPDLKFKASYSKLVQYLHLLTPSDVGLPSDLWVPTTKNVRPQEAWQATLGLDYYFKKNWHLSIEGYYKQLNNIINYEEGSSFLVNSTIINESSIIDATNWENKVTRGKGESKGIEVFVEKNKGRFSTWFNYSLSWTNRRFDSLNDGEAFPFRFDRRHHFKIAAAYQISKKVKVSANWIYGTGLATTIPRGEFTYTTSNLFPPTSAKIFSGQNDSRMPAYHRLDLSTQIILGRKKGNQLLKIGIYNVYNRTNPLYYRLKTDLETNEKSHVQIYLLPITPSISYTIKL